ncbi:T9SS type B sorting domain-containing protein [Flavobacterium salilacus subsp. salilacus]|uniref:T9SS type B sorting domain-containing protein n=1 Tax=Flavobacterium TaxID=237 RepID=UPI001074EAA3|nr:MULTISPECIES: gliding motility-associated C-terminal domain-containing protein [Flavobacterium]KAF2518563.1 T9SS type B sorting domain-containing protein [Flavobacterium salilacus subsp. salilacus]MBE1613519.1 gliding motility-associated C-terminal domain-containing protein [Flavobacterium sp. SaA2.13]
MKKSIIRLTPLRLLSVLCMLLYFNTGSAQIYLHDFGTTPISSYPYTVAPAVADADISNSSWTNNIGIWVSFIGQSGVGLGHANAVAGSTMTLTFDVAPGKQLDITSFNFWRARTNSAAQNWTMTINGISVGSGGIPVTGAAIGNTPVANPVTELTGTVTVVISLSNPFGAGSFVLDNFELNGFISEPCVPPAITEIVPASGPAGTTVTITGSGFEAGTTAVQFNGVDAESFTVISDTEIEAVVPANTSTGAITVTTNDCEAPTSIYTFLESDCPPTGSSSEVYISELYDHVPGSWGMIELYNPTANTITFGGQYVLTRAGDIGGGESYSLTLPGSIPAFSTYQVRSYGSGVVACGSVPVNANMGQGINGNDEFKLYKNGTVIDRAYAPSNAGYTVIRNEDAVAPKTTHSWADWTTTSQNCADLGMHTALIASTISTQPTDQEIACGGGNVQFSVSVSNSTGFSYQWKTIDESGNWVNITNGAQYSGATTNTLTVINPTAALLGSQYYCEIVSITCTLISNAVTITGAAGDVGNITTSVTHPTCINSNGTIEVTAPTGEEYEYSINGVDFQDSPVFTVASGIYVITVTNTQGCTSDSNNITVNDTPDTPAVATVDVTQPTCTNPNGTIEVTAPTGGEYEYSINGVDFQDSPVFTVAAGIYNITVRNNDLCTSVTDDITINDAPDAPAVATVDVTQPTCTNPNGTIEVTAPTGAEYEYSINGVDFQDSPVFTVAAGIYIITVRNNDLCTSVTDDITINDAPDAPAVATVDVTQPTCTNSNGTIEVTAPTGAEYEYSINGVDFQDSPVFTVATGIYNITVRNNDLCTSITDDITINDAPDTPAVATVDVTQPTCTNPDGTIEVTAPTGAEYEYSINGVDFQDSPVFTVAAGIYNITVRNNDLCTSVTDDITINDAPDTPAVATIDVTQPTCTNPDGLIEVIEPIGGDLEYSIDGINFQASTLFTVTSGTYNVTVRNNDLCTSITDDITINDAPDTPAVATIDVTQPTCTNPDGTIEVTAPTGAEYEYSINGVDFQDSPVFTVAAGIYNITVRNNDLCTSVTDDITINDAPDTPAVATIDVTQPTCTNPDGLIEVIEPIGGDLEYSIDGINFQASTLFTVTPGTYNVTVINAEGCTSVTNDIIINNAPDAPAVATIDVTQPTCNDSNGIIEVTDPTGAGLEYSIDGVNFQTTATFTVTAGTYNITVMNAAGCISVTDDIIINNAPATPAVTGIQGCTDTAFGQRYMLEAQPIDNSFNISTASYTWMINNSVIGNNENTFDVTQYVNDNSINGDDYPLNIILTVTSTTGCTATYTFTIVGILCDIPRGISPNGDGLNDNFDLSGLNAKKVAIFNRYGKEVYTRNNYINEWEGQTDNGDELPTGTYFYVIETTDDSKTGWVYINRQEN